LTASWIPWWPSSATAGLPDPPRPLIWATFSRNVLDSTLLFDSFGFGLHKSKFFSFLFFSFFLLLFLVEPVVRELTAARVQEEDFETLKVLGRGGFGEVRPTLINL